MKNTVLASLLFATLPLTSFAENFEGHRVGAGFSETVEVLNGYTYYGDTGLHLEYGYDFNRIVGLNVTRDTSGSSYNNLKLDTTTWKVGADIGYAFEFSKWDLKPYGAIGLQRSNIEYSAFNQSIDVNDTSLYLGFGVRAHLDMGIYFDLKANAFQVSEPYSTDIGQSSFTVGYKF